MTSAGTSVLPISPPTASVTVNVPPAMDHVDVATRAAKLVAEVSSDTTDSIPFRVTASSGDSDLAATTSLSTETVPCPSSEISAPPTEGLPSPDEVDMIDSALLSALRDPRERLGLLKLEQVLLEFLEKQPQDVYMDVGGPYNSVAISPSLGVVGGGGGDPFSAGGGSSNVRPQTTFQRCILHRLCDRFHMTREKSNVNDGYGNYYIRVVKGLDSRRPPRLLLNVQPSEYSIKYHNCTSSNNGEYNNSNGGGYSSNHNFGSANNSNNHSNSNLNASFEQLGLASPSSSNLPLNGDSSNPSAPSSSAISAANPNSKSNGGGGNNNKPRKMKIMRRSNSSNVSENSKADKSCKPKNRNTLSEKEKMYAEARARIFQDQEEEASSSSPADAVNSSSPEHQQQERQSMNSVQQQTTPAPWSTDDGSPKTNTSNPSSTSSTPTPTPPSSAPLPASVGAAATAPPNNNTCEDTHQQGRTKATYRNREQEEADPDFRRGVGIAVVPSTSAVPMTAATAAPYIPTATAAAAAAAAGNYSGYYHHLHQTPVSSAAGGGRGYYMQPYQYQQQLYFQQQQQYQQFYAVAQTQAPQQHPQHGMMYRQQHPYSGRGSASYPSSTSSKSLTSATASSRREEYPGLR